MRELMDLNYHDDQFSKEDNVFGHDYGAGCPPVR